MRVILKYNYECHFGSFLFLHEIFSTFGCFPSSPLVLELFHPFMESCTILPVYSNLDYPLKGVRLMLERKVLRWKGRCMRKSGSLELDVVVARYMINEARKMVVMCIWTRRYKPHHPFRHFPLTCFPKWPASLPSIPVSIQSKILPLPWLISKSTVCPAPLLLLKCWKVALECGMIWGSVCTCTSS
jgi:hypothetical protein